MAMVKHPGLAAVRCGAVCLALGAAWACTEPNPDYDPDAAAALCSGGERRCSGDRPQVCAQSGEDYSWTDDYCPAGGGCAEGRCVPPAGAPACQRDADCGANVCVAFAAGGGIARYCAPATGTLPGGAACQEPTDCQSGLCLRQSTGPAQCDLACAGPEDCDQTHTCQETDVTITGQRGKLRGCMVP